VCQETGLDRKHLFSRNEIKHHEEDRTAEKVLERNLLSAYAEDHGLCPWMNAGSAAKSFLCS